MFHIELVEQLAKLNLEHIRSTDSSFKCYNAPETHCLKWRTNDEGKVTRAYVRANDVTEYAALLEHIEEHPAYVVEAFIQNFVKGLER